MGVALSLIALGLVWWQVTVRTKELTIAEDGDGPYRAHRPLGHLLRLRLFVGVLRVLFILGFVGSLALLASIYVDPSFPSDLSYVSQGALAVSYCVIWFCGVLASWRLWSECDDALFVSDESGDDDGAMNEDAGRAAT